MGIDYLTAHYVLAAILWAALYLADYYLTLRSATVYLRGANERLVFQRGIELNPVFENDIARRRKFSIRFFGFYTIGLFMLIGLGVYADPLLYEAIIGAFLLEWAVIDLRHLRNLWFFRTLCEPGAVEGKLVYTHRFSLRSSGIDLLLYAALYLFCAWAAGRLFFVGGAVACTLLAVRQFVLARRAAQGAKVA
ncbi:MAG: hypothetical protein U0350_34620 [Caldilineaceae bacterium]